MSIEDMNQNFRTEYQPLLSLADEVIDDEQEVPPSHNIQQTGRDHGRAQKWNHIVDLDEFFIRVYQYHQRSGFFCMVLQDVLQLAQFVFVVVFSTFLLSCVDYSVLFMHHINRTVTLDEAIVPVQQCMSSLHPAIIVCLVVAGILWIFRFSKIIYNIFQYWEIRMFFICALKITQTDLVNMTWHEVQRRLLEVQKELQMCIHKAELTELGGPFSPFENNWHLKPDYRNTQKRKELADTLSRHILWIGVVNFIFAPLIFVWQIFYSFFRYAEMIKREPGTLGSRKWSLYSRLFLRHFNELDHEFNARLNQAYRPADKYVNLFISPMLVIVAKHVAFFVGSILAVIIILGCVDQDFFQVENLFRTVTVFGIVIAVCQGLIPDEHMVSCPELLMRAILAQIHYMPDSWKGCAHTYGVRNEFTQLFQYKATFLAEELFSPIVTPFILCFSLRNRAPDIIDFYRNFTVNITGVGDVCSFAQMDIKKHGHPEWAPAAARNEDSDTYESGHYPAECGKTELSLLHFTLTNPEWKPPQTETNFIKTLKTRAQREIANINLLPADNPLLTSSNSLTQLGPRYNSFMLGTLCRSSLTAVPASSTAVVEADPVATSLHYQAQNAAERNALCVYDEGTLEYLSAEMSFSALYMHDMHRQKKNRTYVDQPVGTAVGTLSEDERARAVWQTDSNSSPSSPHSFRPMSDIQEEEDASAGGKESDYLMTSHAV